MNQPQIPSTDQIERKEFSQGAIRLDYLAALMGQDEKYWGFLPVLWRESPCREKDLPKDRSSAWYELFYSTLPFFIFDPMTRNLITPNKNSKSDSDSVYILLAVLKKFLNGKGVPIPQELKEDQEPDNEKQEEREADEEEAGFVFDELNRLHEEYDPEELKELKPRNPSEHKYKRETLEAHNKELKALFKKPAEPHSEKQNKELLPCKPGTRWEQITMTEVPSEIEDEEPMFRVKTPNGEELYTFHLLGMHHKQKPNRPLARWTLLKLFAQKHGFITGIQHNSLLSDHKRLLDKHLQEIFGINESIYKGHAKKLRGHKTRITFRSEVYRSICESTADRRNPEDY